MELITLTTKTRGRNSRDVEYQGVGRIVKDDKGNEEVVSEGVITESKQFLALPGVDGNLQKMLDFAVVGYNRYARESALDVDEFAEFIETDWDEKRIDAFKRSVRALAKVIGETDEDFGIPEAAALVKSRMQKAELAAK
jgi:hypothetical protein